MRIVLALTCLVLATLCGLGLLASFEPGVALFWKLAYGGGAGAFLIAAAMLMRPKRRLHH